MFDHIGFPVKNYAAARAFYDKALAPLGVKMLYQVPREYTGGRDVCGYGKDRPQFWLGEGEHKNQSIHIAFEARDRKTVDAFYAAAMEAGGTDNGKPGSRPHYHEHYYGAFVIDLDGNNIEAVCHTPA